MGTTHYEYYLLAGKKQQQAFEDFLSQKKKVTRELNKLKKKYKIKSLASHSFGTERTIAAVVFEDGVTVDEKVWKTVETEIYRAQAYWPRKNTSEGKKILAEFEPWRKLDAKNVAEAVNYPQILFWSNHAYPFNMGYNSAKKICYFVVPELPDGEETPKDWYKPVRGVKKIKYVKLVELLGAKP